MKSILLLALCAVGCGTWPKETANPDPNTFHEVLLGVNTTEADTNELGNLIQEYLPKLNIGAIDITIVPLEDVRKEPYKSQYDCKGLYVGCTDLQKDVSHSLIGWDDTDPRFLYDNTAIVAHELAHVWLFQTTGDGDKHHKHQHLFGRDDTGKLVDPDATVFQIANEYYVKKNH